MDRRAALCALIAITGCSHESSIASRREADSVPQCWSQSDPTVNVCFSYECTTNQSPPAPDAPYDPNNPYWARDDNPDGSPGALVWSSTPHAPYLPYVAGGAGPFLIPTQDCPSTPPIGGFNDWPDALAGMPPDGSGGLNCCWNTSISDSPVYDPDGDGATADSVGPFDGVPL